MERNKTETSVPVSSPLNTCHVLPIMYAPLGRVVCTNGQQAGGDGDLDSVIDVLLVNTRDRRADVEHW